MAQLERLSGIPSARLKKVFSDFAILRNFLQGSHNFSKAFNKNKQFSRLQFLNSCNCIWSFLDLYVCHVFVLHLTESDTFSLSKAKLFIVLTYHWWTAFHRLPERGLGWWELESAEVRDVRDGTDWSFQFTIFICGSVH